MNELPTFSLTEIERRRDRIFTTAFESRLNQTVAGEDLDCLVRDLRRALPALVTADTIFESVRHLAGQTLTGPVAMTTAWRMAGNLPQLKSGAPVAPWSIQHADEWVPLQAIRCLPGRDDRNRFGYEFWFRVLAGSPCPMQIRSFMRAGRMQYLAQQVGFSKPFHNYPYQRAEQLIGLRFLGKIEAKHSHRDPAFYETAASPTMVAWNRQNILRLRLRVGEQCPRGWTHPCHRCAIGYENCNAATHRRDYTRGLCPTCHDPQAIFDPEAGSTQCLNCIIKQRLKKKT